MRSTLLLLLFIGGAMAQNYYPNIMSDREANMLLRDTAMLRQVVRCLTGQGRCDSRMTRAKSLIPEVISTDCARCSDSQKAILRRLFRKVSSSFPEEWQQLLAKYEPQGTSRTLPDNL